MRKISLTILIFALIFAISSCSSDDDKNQVQEEKMFTSEWISPSSWSFNQNSLNGKDYYFDITEPKLTQDVLDNGLVLVYLKFYHDEFIRLLPVTSYATPTMFINVTSQQFLGKLKIIYQTNSNIVEPSLNNKFRYIIIPGDAQTTTSANQRVYNLRGTNYTESQLKSLDFDSVNYLLSNK